MIVQGASEAEVQAALAMYGGHDTVELAGLDLAVNGKHAVRCRAPFQVFEVIDVCSREKLGVSAVS
jgi:hypothetical protein